MKYYFIFFIIISLYDNSIVGMLSEIKSLRVNHSRALLYMPWRSRWNNTITNSSIQLVQTATIQSQTQPCIFCKILQENRDEENYVLYRGKQNSICLATQPYVSNGMHFLIIPYVHEKELANLSPDHINELNELTQKLCIQFSASCDEINIGINMGRFAGASIPDHLHQHIVIDRTPHFDNINYLRRVTIPKIDLKNLFNEFKQQIIILNTNNGQRNTQSLSKIKYPCYHCSVLHNNIDDENLIIYRGNDVTIMMEHYPKYPGQIAIVPHTHIEHIGQMSDAVYQELITLGKKIYPLLYLIMQISDLNVGINFYGENSNNKQHVRLQIIPRKQEFIGSIEVISEKTFIQVDIEQLHKRIKEEFDKIK